MFDPDESDLESNDGRPVWLPDDPQVANAFRRAARDYRVVKQTGWTFEQIDAAEDRRLSDFLTAASEADRAQAKALERMRADRGSGRTPHLSDRQVLKQAEKLNLPPSIPPEELDELLNNVPGLDPDVWGRPDG